jgi:uncharacterized protein (DUF2062 family)
MSVRLHGTPRLALGVGEFSPVPQILPIARPLHWLDIARPIYRFFANPLTMAIVWGAVYILSALVACGWLLVVML